MKKSNEKLTQEVKKAAVEQINLYDSLKSDDSAAKDRAKRLLGFLKRHILRVFRKTELFEKNLMKPFPDEKPSETFLNEVTKSAIASIYCDDLFKLVTDCKT